MSPIPLHLLYCDESNLEEKSGDFLLYGGLMIATVAMKHNKMRDSAEASRDQTSDNVEFKKRMEYDDAPKLKSGLRSGMEVRAVSHQINEEKK